MATKDAWGLLLDAARIGLDGLPEDHPAVEHLAAALALLDALQSEGSRVASREHAGVLAAALESLTHATGALLNAPTPLAQAQAMLDMATTRSAARSVLHVARRAADGA